MPQPIHGCGQPASPTLTPLASGPKATHLADILVAKRHRQLHATIRQAHPLAAAQIEPAVGEMQIAVANAGCQDLQQHFAAVRLRRGLLVELQRLAADANLEHAHFEFLPAHVPAFHDAARNAPAGTDELTLCGLQKIYQTTALLAPTAAKSFRPDQYRLDRARGDLPPRLRYPIEPMASLALDRGTRPPPNAPPAARAT